MTTATLEKVHRLYVAFEKKDEAKRMVYGYASTEAVDSQGEIISYDAIKGALDEYMKFANLREMHSMKAAGIVKVAEARDDERKVWIGAKVVDNDAWLKVTEGVYKGFSIGGTTLERQGREITKLRLSEISLVDRPSNPESMIELYKADGAASLDQKMDLMVELIQSGVVGQQVAEALAKAKASLPAIVKTEVTTDLAKSLYGVGSLAEVIDRLGYLYLSSVQEEEFEGDITSKVPSMLADALSVLGQALIEMAAEEVSELNLGGETPTTKGVSVMAKVKKEDVYKRIAECETAMKAMRAEVEKGAGDEVEGDDVEKMFGDAFKSPAMVAPAQKAEGAELELAMKSGDMRKVFAVMAKAQEAKRDQQVTDLAKAVSALTEQVTKLATAPLPPKAAVADRGGIAKADDTKPIVDAEAKDDLAKAVEAKDPLAAMKAIHKAGGSISPAGVN